MKGVTGSREYLCLVGSPYNRGLDYGRTLKTEINELIDGWKKNIKRNSGMEPDKFISDFVKYNNYTDAIKKYTPDLLEEVKGLAEGSEVDFDTMYTFQLLDELILNSGDLVSHCSSIGVKKNDGRPAVLGQNWDIESYVNNYQTTLHIKEEDGTESFIFTYAGLIAAFGVNNHGVGICLNSIPILKYSNSGLPVAYVIRGVLSCRTKDDAVKFVKSVVHASPQNYIISDYEGFTDLECSFGEVAEYTFDENPDIVFHTNHPLINTNYDDKYKTLLNDRVKGIKTVEAYHDAVEYLEKDSHTRFNSLEKRLGRLSSGEIDKNKIHEILSSQDSEENPVCMSLGDEYKMASIVSTVIEMIKPEPVFHIAFGPPNVTEYKTHTFSNPEGK